VELDVCIGLPSGKTLELSFHDMTFLAMTLNSEKFAKKMILKAIENEL